MQPKGHRRVWFVWLIYAAAIAASFWYQRSAHHQPAASVRPQVSVHAFNGRGDDRGTLTIAYDDHQPTSPSNLPAVILIHGSPGNGSEMRKLARPIAAAGYRVITPDLPGFGESTLNPPSLSILAHAHEVLALMDELQIKRAHILGWSLGGGVAMLIVDLAPDRVASLTLMASISDQSVEGTRSYVGEHAKYAAGYAAATVVQYGIPHFGLLSHFSEIRASMRNFWDSDMRPLTDLMRRIQTPTLILHGRNDFLVPYWAAEHSHELIRPSTLLMTPYSHFFPFMQPEFAAARLIPFFRRHDEPGPGLRQRIDIDPPAPRYGRIGQWLALQLRTAHWLTLIAAGAALILWRGRTSIVILFFAVSFSLIDNGIAFGAIFLALCIAFIIAYRRGVHLRQQTTTPKVIGAATAAHPPQKWEQFLRWHPILTALRTCFVPREQQIAVEALAFHRIRSIAFPIAMIISWCLLTFFYFIATILASIFIARELRDRIGTVGLVIGIILSIILIRAIELCLTRHGRRRLRMSITRIFKREYWAAELLYWPMAPYFTYLGLRYGPIAFTACNPGIDNGGGVIGESKQRIIDRLPRGPEVLASVLIERDDDEARRTAAILSAIHDDSRLTFPVILKPDSGYRGFAVKLARSPEDVAAYVKSMRAPAIVQQYHPGPHECGILWARNPTNPEGPGFIFSITSKEFPVLIGDGKRTLEQLIFRHPRFHAQAGTFLERFADQRCRALGKGEQLRLAVSGNHCQGTLFKDGSALITPELSARIDELARGFGGSIKQGLDIGRFDVRFESEAELRQGRGFAIVELNGVTGESTNIYDPARSIVWAFEVAMQQWRLMYQLGAWRISTGHRALPVAELFRQIRAHKNSRSGPALAD